MINYIKHPVKSVLNSYSAIFFSDKLVFSFILLIVSFFDIYAGLSGLVSVIVSNLLAFWLGYDRNKIIHGLYGFNNLLVGLGLGLHFEFNYVFLLILILSSLFTFFLTVAFEGILGKYALPYLSIPFLLGIWLLTLACRQFGALGVSERGIYIMNDLYALGGNKLVNLYNWWNNLPIIPSVKIYFISLGAIFFQYNVLAGILIAAGILYYSRIAFTLSLLGFYSAYVFYALTGTDITHLNYTYIGFNYILTAIAVGGFFLIPSRSSYLWVVLLTPLVAILTISLSSVFDIYQLSIYSLPFNMVVLMFIYILKLRITGKHGLTEVPVQHGSPEKNLYSFQNNNLRFADALLYIPLKLPFWGEWMVYQGHDGQYTHKDEWKYAWDFFIKDNEGKSFKLPGNKPEDYYCYNKTVLSPADGIVEEIYDNVFDNDIGNINLKDNWGNTIIVRHTNYLFSKMSHLKAGSFKVSKGEFVKQGQVLASCGNSGRSPEPHLHFQFQTTPHIDSKTIDYPISSYIVNKNNELKLKSFGKPKVNELVSNTENNGLLKNAFNFIPGRKIKLEVTKNSEKEYIEWEVFTNMFNQSYIYCKKTESAAYFTQDNNTHYFKYFEGDKSSVLYYFFLSAFRINMGFYKDISVTDTFPLYVLFSKPKLFLQDFFAPFFIFFKAEYRVTCESIDDVISPNTIILLSEVKTYYFNREQKKIKFKLTVNRQGLNKLAVESMNKNTEIKCVE